MSVLREHKGEGNESSLVIIFVSQRTELTAAYFVMILGDSFVYC